MQQAPADNQGAQNNVEEDADSEEIDLNIYDIDEAPTNLVTRIQPTASALMIQGHVSRLKFKEVLRGRRVIFPSQGKPASKSQHKWKIFSASNTD